MFEALLRDLRCTFRSLRHRPGFTLIVVLSLALGIGANTAIFSVVDAVLLRPLPIPNSDKLVVVDVAASRLQQYGNVSYLDWKDFTARSRTFGSLAIESDVSAGMNTGSGEPQVVFGMLVSGNFFPTLQIRPQLGRYFRPEEDEVPGKFPVAVISDSLWTRAFARDANIIGRQIKLNGNSFTVVGITPKSFTGPNIFTRPDFYVPTQMVKGMNTDGNDTLTHRGWREFSMVGRLKPGVTVAQAQSEMDGIMRDLDQAYPDTNKGVIAYVRTDMQRRMLGGALLLPAVLMGLVLLVLLIACANVASLFMARATARMREISTQLAVGATRGILIRQLLTESAVLAGMGATGGIVLGYACIQGFTAMLPDSATPMNPDFHLDSRVLVFTLAVSGVAVLLCGLAPALSTVREAMLRVVSNVRAGNSEGRAYGAVARRILVAGQIALSTILLVGGALFLKSFLNAQKVDLGFNPEHLLLVATDPSMRGYSPEKAQQFELQLLRQTVDLAGVKSASVASSVPFLSGASWDLAIDGYTNPSGERFVDLPTNQVAPGYFKTMQIPLLRGREFTDHDNNQAPLVAIVNESMARRYIVPDGDLEKAIGHKVSLRDHEGIPIVGVVKDSVYFGRIGAAPQPVFYMSYAQMGRSSATLHVRTAGDPAALTGQIRAELKKLDPEVAPVSVLTMTRAVSGQGLLLQRVTAILGGAFGLVALSLAIVGLYGVVSFLVARRTQEIGVRIALGAQRGKILKMVLADGIYLSLAGLAVGAAGAFLATPLMGGLLLGVSPHDPLILLAIAILLMTATLAASWLPARRATRVDPMVALRYE